MAPEAAGSTSGSRAGQAQLSANDGAAVSQERMIREATTFLIQASRTAPLILVACIDIQWADISTLNLLLDLTSRLEGARIVIVITYRPHEVRGTKNPFRDVRPQMRRRGSYREIFPDFQSKWMPATIFACNSGLPVFSLSSMRWCAQGQRATLFSWSSWPAYLKGSMDF